MKKQRGEQVLYFEGQQLVALYFEGQQLAAGEGYVWEL